MKRNKYLLIAFFVSFSFTTQAQERDFEKEFEDFQNKAGKDYSDFKNKADEEFAGFLREVWAKFEASEPIPPPVRPEPVKPQEFDEDKPVEKPVEIVPKEPQPVTVPDPEPEDEPVMVLDPDPVKKPATPAKDKPTDKPDPGVYVPGKPYTPVVVEAPKVPPGPSVKRTPIRFYGTTLQVATSSVEKLSLTGMSESNIADAWTKVCKADYEQLIKDCMTIRKERKLNDWAYVLFTKQIGTQLYGSNRTKEITFLQMFLLAKSGYKVKLAKINDELKLMLAPAATLYGAPYITLSGTRYYIFEPREQQGKLNIYTYEQEFANSKNHVALYMPGVPVFEMVPHTKTLQSKNKDVIVQTVVNKNLIDFYKDYPQCNVEIHYKTPMSAELKNSLYPPLKKAIEGKSQKDAANILITFVQTAFPYMTDGEQFGYEKPNFYEENFFYPYNDCEDRAMLYATLVKDLLGLNVILLDYPDHIASAVNFTENIQGDYVTFEDQKYIICDPTYIGASIGMCMEQYKSVSPAVIR
ncbi:hypothetical protein [Bacteroides sp. 519]|uniref:hypothetical protein n=1 Tax=Bacteroides sp. 519 TaxID=2302937 RepID=UPI0013D48066|nr:hypothetical protein [Bacteroides sp. 519]NDV57258.1 hypothetical protein [Bacteroides sp. 519]